MKSNDCTCKVVPPRHEYAYMRLFSSYTWRVDSWEDDTKFDPKCPFHGENGTMVAVLRGKNQ